MIYMAAGGAPVMFLYKGINTMDSMLGYKNDKYLYFGRCAAKLDDLANYLPARISGWLMVAASFFSGMNGKNAAKSTKGTERNHASPNSAQTEAAMAGALEIQLAGNAYYFGKLYEKPTIGDSLRPVEPEDIRRANRLMYATASIKPCDLCRSASGIADSAVAIWDSGNCKEQDPGAESAADRWKQDELTYRRQKHETRTWRKHIYLSELHGFFSQLQSSWHPGKCKTGSQRQLDRTGDYPQVGYAPLREALGEYEDMDPRHIICGNGAAELIFSLCQADAPKRPDSCAHIC